MAQGGRGPFCEYFCELTRMRTVPIVFCSRCRDPMSTLTALLSESGAGTNQGEQELLPTLWTNFSPAPVRDRLIWCGEEVCVVWIRACLYTDLFRSTSTDSPPWIASSTSLSPAKVGVFQHNLHCWIRLNMDQEQVELAGNSKCNFSSCYLTQNLP